MLSKESFLRPVHFYKGKAVNFRVDAVRIQDGEEAKREYLVHPGAVAALPLLSPGRVILVRQYRYPVGKYTWEIPAGKVAPGETPRFCLMREIAEEIGYKPRYLKRIISYWPSTAFSTEILHIYLAKDLVKVTASPDSDEFLESKAFSLEDVWKAVEKGTIGDSKTLLALLFYRSFRHRFSG